MEFKSIVIFSFASLLMMGCQKEGGSSSSSSSGEPMGPEISSVCQEGKSCRVLPFGDAVVEGIELNANNTYVHNGGFRKALFEAAREDSKYLNFVGLRENGPDTAAGTDFPKKHSGFSAISLKNLLRMLPQPTKKFKHDIVLLHAGTFEVASMTTEGVEQALNEAAESFNRVIVGLYEINPDALIAVSNFYELSQNHVLSLAFSLTIEGLVDEFKSLHPKAKIVLVDHRGLTLPRGSDTFTLNGFGYDSMGYAWYEAIKPYL